MSMEYKGWVELQDQNLADFYNNKDNFDASDILENQYVFCGNEVYRMNNGFFNRVSYPTITSTWNGSLKPRNREQIAAMDMMKHEQSKIKLICGKPGTGKTLILVASALERLENEEFEKIVFIRNNVQVRDTDSLGALPGGELEKMLPYLGPLLDHIGGSEAALELVERNRLEVIPLGFLRGRSIRNSLIFCTEGENLTKQQIQLIMGRIDEGSELYMDADVKQRDKVNFEKSKGIETMIDRLKGEPLFGYVHLEKTERSPMSALADKLDD